MMIFFTELKTRNQNEFPGMRFVKFTHSSGAADSILLSPLFNLITVPIHLWWGKKCLHGIHHKTIFTEL